jgi:hypothetical protein
LPSGPRSGLIETMTLCSFFSISSRRKGQGGTEIAHRLVSVYSGCSATIDYHIVLLHSIQA